MTRAQDDMPAAGAPLAYRDGATALTGELFSPTGPANGRAVLVVHEADGIGGNVRRRAAMLAAQGYAALAADLHGPGAPLAGAAMHAALDQFRAAPDLLRQRVAAGLGALADATGTARDAIAAIGYCFGGLAVLELARSGAELCAVASFHGLLTTAAPARPGGVRARVAAFTGARDPLVPPADVAAFQAEMTAADADWQLSVYGRAWHSFTNPAVDGLNDPRMRYDPRADAASWAALATFLDAAFAARAGAVTSG